MKDFSGRPGARCQLCNRRSDFVGPTRGFDYANSVCGGCYDLSDGEGDGETCKGCGGNLYELPSEIDDYCGNCVEMCDACYELVIASEKVAIALSPAVHRKLSIHQQLIDTDERAEEIGLNDMEDGEMIELCIDCASAMDVGPSTSNQPCDSAATHTSAVNPSHAAEEPSLAVHMPEPSLAVHVAESSLAVHVAEPSLVVRRAKRKSTPSNASPAAGLIAGIARRQQRKRSAAAAAGGTRPVSNGRS